MLESIKAKSNEEGDQNSLWGIQIGTQKSSKSEKMGKDKVLSQIYHKGGQNFFIFNVRGVKKFCVAL